MKKIIILLLVLLSFSCSKDEDTATKEIEVTVKNVSGTWKIDKVIRADGVKEDYLGFCTTKPFIYEIFQYGVIKWNFFTNDCLIEGNDATSGWYLSGKKIKDTTTDLDEGNIVSLTSNTMRVEFETPQDLGFSDNENSKAILLFR